MSILSERVAMFLRLKGIVLCFFAILALSSCGTGQTQIRSVDLNSHEDLATDMLATAVLNRSDTIVDVANSQFGPGRAAVGAKYLSALGMPCRPVVFVNNSGDRYNLAVCAEKDNVWATAPPIFVTAKL